MEFYCINILTLEDSTEYFEFPAIRVTNKNMAVERVYETSAVGQVQHVVSCPKMTYGNRPRKNMQLQLE